MRPKKIIPYLKGSMQFEEKLDVIMDKMDRCNKLKIVLPDFEHIRKFPDMLKEEIDLLRLNFTDEIKKALRSLIQDPDPNNGIFAEVKHLVDKAKPFVEDTENKIKSIAREVQFAWLLIRVIVVGVVICLLVNLATNIALLTSKETLYLSLPIILLLVIIIIARLRTGKTKTSHSYDGKRGSVISDAASTTSERWTPYRNTRKKRGQEKNMKWKEI